MNSKHIHKIPWFLVALGPCILFGPMLARGEVLFWGTPMMQFVPWRQFALQVMRSGHLPLWNPWLGMGAPLYANYQSALLYPPNFLLTITGVEWGHGLLMALHLVWAGLGMVVLTRQLSLNPLAQVVAGVSFSLSGYLVARGGFLSINASVAWLPWIISGVEHLVQQAANETVDRTTGRAVLFTGMMIAFQLLAGHAQIAWYTLLLAFIWVGWRSFRIGRRRGFTLSVLLMAGAYTIAFALSAVQLLPTLEYLAQSHRAVTFDPGYAMTYSFWPWRLLGLLMPDLFGNPATGDYWGYGNYWEDAIYIGVLPLLLALSAVWRGIRTKREHQALSRFLIVLAVIALLLAMGKNTRIFPFLFDHVPTFNLFQAPTRWNLILVFMLTLLAGIGADGWGLLSERGLYWTRLGTVGAGVIGIAAVLGARLLGDVDQSFVRAFSLAGLWLVVAGILSLRNSGRPLLLWNFIAGLVTMIDLSVAGLGLNPTVPIDVYRGRSSLEENTGGEHRVYMPPDVEYDLKFEHIFRFDSFRTPVDWRMVRDIGLPNTTILEGISSSNNFDPILPNRYVVWMETLETLPHVQGQNMLALMDVGWVARLDPMAGNGVRYDPIPDPSRVRLVSEAISATSPEEALTLVSAHDFDPSQTVVLEEISMPWSSQDGVGGTFDLLDSLDPNRVKIRANSPSGSWLVLSDAWYPGWSAEVDEVESRIYHADYLFRGVWVPPGEHDIEFIYRPILFVIGGAVSLLAWLAFAMIGWRWRSG